MDPYLSQFFERANQYPEWLHRVTLTQVVLFVREAALAKQRIILLQDCTVSPSEPPPTLPAQVLLTLSHTVRMSANDVQISWDILKDLVWDDEDMRMMSQDPRDALHAHGNPYGVAGTTLWPPHHWCQNTACERQTLLKSTEERNVYIFTLDRGVVPATSIHLYCARCHTNYHHNYSVRTDDPPHVKKKTYHRTYYKAAEQLGILQVGEHHFVERRLVNVWTAFMLNSWASATGCASTYNSTMSEHPDGIPLPPGWDLSPTLRTDHVWDAFIVVSLLGFFSDRDWTLRVPHDKAQADRFADAMRARNAYVQMFGLGERAHCCSKCVRFTYDANGVPIKRTACVVVDGVTIGHPCCSVHNCQNALASNRDRFCPAHTHLKSICAVAGCDRPVVDKSRVCDHPVHRSMESYYRLRGTSRFLYRKTIERAKRAGASLGDGTEQVISVDDLDADEQDELEAFLHDSPEAVAEEVFEIDEFGHAINADRPAPVTSREAEARASRGDTAPSPNATLGTWTKRETARFGRKRTHNEQIIVAPCGVIIARITFYHAEAVSSVGEFIRRTYRMMRFRPDHIFFDNNCLLRKHLNAIGDRFFDNIGLSVDAFHFSSKHKKTDTFCRKHCDPRKFPELLNDDGSYYFNSSIAEQTNNWLTNYNSILREMRVEKFNFFLDEMIMLRNRKVIAKLERQGATPMTWPGAGF